MPEFINNSGIFGWLILIIAAVIGVLIVRTALALARARSGTAVQARAGLHAILFWGVMCALLGFLGQAMGIYLALNAFGREAEVSPSLVMNGFAISFTPTILGMVVLFLSALAWFALRALAARSTPIEGEGEVAGLVR